MQLGAEAVFVGSGIFKSCDPVERARAMVQAATFYDDPDKLASISMGLGEGMAGLEISELKDSELFAGRGA
jgi:pyridoxal 5'-phosphate synthase pdxS subunit